MHYTVFYSILYILPYQIKTFIFKFHIIFSLFLNLSPLFSVVCTLRYFVTSCHFILFVYSTLFKLESVFNVLAALTAFYQSLG